jgi:hypothetical protein
MPKQVNKNNNYLKNILKKQPLITDYFKKIIYGYDRLNDEWHCCECGQNMGKGNPRQLCGKYYCEKNHLY